MNKENALNAIHEAKKAHELQMEKIEATINGKDIQNPTAVVRTECSFGRWLYDENNHIKEILGLQFFTNLEVAHTKWHNEYMKIYDIFFEGRKKAFFSDKLKPKKVSEMDLDKAKLYYVELKETTDELLRAIASSERRLSALSESKFH